MFKKISVMTIGIAAGLVAAAPLASATESQHGHDGHESAPTCSAATGDASAVSEISGDSLANSVAQAPVGGSNIGNCSSITVVDFGDSFELPQFPQL